MSGAVSAPAVVAAARALVGVPFRLQGRSERMGLDCVGLVALALTRAGHRGVVPAGYDLRWHDGGRVRRWLRAARLRQVDIPADGDVTLVRPGPLQTHLMIVVPGGFIHGHAGLRRVVETPGASPWPVIGHWRAMPIEEEL
ncbi:MAG: peptidoglycan endopeptidase [Sphingobium sp.]